MANRKTNPPNILLSEIGELADDIRDQVFANCHDPTQIIVPSISGTIDIFTEEITYHTLDTLYNASGIVGSVAEADSFPAPKDSVYGLRGQIQVGDTKVTYPYHAVSGVLGFEGVNQIKLLSPGVSGLYHIASHSVDILGDTPLFVDYVLKVDRND